MLYKVTPFFSLITELEKLICNRFQINQTSKNKKKNLLCFIFFHQEVPAAWFNNRQAFPGDVRNEKCEQLRTHDH